MNRRTADRWRELEWRRARVVLNRDERRELAEIERVEEDAADAERLRLRGDSYDD